jgi:PAS domain S-box-containing protein
MHIVPFLHFTVFLIDLALIVVLLSKNIKARVNQACAVLIFMLAIWSFGFCGINLTSDPQSSLMWDKVSSIGWCLFPVAAVYFYLVLTRRDTTLRNRIFLVLSAGLAIYFLYQSWAGNILSDLIQTPYWRYWGWVRSPIVFTYFVYYFSLSMVCLYLSYDYGIKSRIEREKKQARILLGTGICSLVLVTIVNVIFPLAGLNILPPAGDIFIMVWEIGIIYSVLKYGLMTLTPEVAAEQILGTMQNSLLLLDTGGKIKLANHSTQELLKSSDNELKEAHFENIVAEKEEVKAFLEETSQKGNCLNREFTYMARDGSSIQVEVSASRVLDQSNASLGFVVVAHDISERKKIADITRHFYEKEKRQREQLEEEAKIRLRFIDILAHELRGPLTPILAGAEMLCEEKCLKSDEYRQKVALNIYHGSQVMAQRLDGLLDLARSARGTFTLNLKETEIPVFIQGVTTRFQPSLDRMEQQLILKLAQDLPRVEIDQSRMEQVIINLLSNANKFSPKQSCIFLTCCQKNGDILCEVRDEGIGISPADQAVLFEPYQRVGKSNNNITGLGLGLSIARQIIDAHGGRIEVSSQLGQGTKFSFTIPIRTSQK